MDIKLDGKHNYKYSMHFCKQKLETNINYAFIFFKLFFKLLGVKMKTLEWEDNKLKLIDQRKLPDELTYVYCDNYQDAIIAIKNMTVRGAPAIGVSAAFAMALADLEGVDLSKAADEIKAARPTAVNLFWAVDRVLNSDDALAEALKMYEEDMATNRAIGKYGAEVIDDGDTVLTHCNAGALACVDYGTALGVFRAARDAGKSINVICDETRPRGQGASLSVWEMQQENIPVKLIPDVASGYLMSQGMSIRWVHLWWPLPQNITTFRFMWPHLTPLSTMI